MSVSYLYFLLFMPKYQRLIFFIPTFIQIEIALEIRGLFSFQKHFVFSKACHEGLSFFIIKVR